MTSDVGGIPLPESLSGPCRRLRYHETNNSKGACLDEDDETWKRVLSEMTFRGLGIWDLGIIGLGFVNLGNGVASFRAIERNGRVSTCLAAPAHGRAQKERGPGFVGTPIKMEDQSDRVRARQYTCLCGVSSCGSEPQGYRVGGSGWKRPVS
jgi:hypothetical protein